MRLSIGVPCYNQGRFLKQTLDSLQSQSIKPFEIVASDNHSDDETSSILETYRNRGIEVIRPPSHLGMVAHWQYVCSHLTGDWISLLSSDDIALPNYVHTLMSAADKLNDCVLVRSPFHTINENGERLDTQWLRSVRKVSGPYENTFEELSFPKVGFAAFAIRRSAFEAVGGFPDLELIGDWGMWIKLAPYGAFLKADEPISCYRVDYRNSLMQQRIFGFIRDDETLDQDIIPEACKRVGIGRRTMRHFSRQRLMLTLDRASTAFPYPEFRQERERVAQSLRARATRCGGLRRLNAFVAGKSIRISRSGARISQTLVRILDCFDRKFRRTTFDVNVGVERS